MAFVVADAAVIGANLIYLTVDEPGREATHPVFSHKLWNGDVDRSWMERVGYVQLAVGAAAGLALWARSRQAVYVVLAALLAWIAVDDAARLHEQFGNLVTERGLDPVGPLSPQVLGELSVWAVAGLAFLGALVPTYRSADPAARRTTRHTLLGLAALLGFALVLDAFDSLITPRATPFVQTLLALTENSGELLAVTVISVILLVALARTRGDGGGGTMATHAPA